MLHEPTTRRNGKEMAYVYASARKSAVSWQGNVAHVTLTARESTLLCSFMHKYTRAVKRTCIGAGYTSVSARDLHRKTARNRVKMCKSAQRKHSSFTPRKNDFLRTWVHTYPRDVDRACVHAYCMRGSLFLDPQEVCTTTHKCVMQRNVFEAPLKRM